MISRGIELSRNDTPNFIKEFQTELLYTLFDCKDSAEIMSKGYENSLLLVAGTIDKVMTGDIKLQDLVVSKLLGQGLDKYKSLFPHVSAAMSETVLGYFGFDRTVYGASPKRKIRKWWVDLKEERLRDRDIERI